MKYKIALYQSDEAYSASGAGLPDCWSQGETQDEAIENVKSAIHDCLVVVDDNLKDADVREVEAGV